MKYVRPFLALIVSILFASSAMSVPQCVLTLCGAGPSGAGGGPVVLSPGWTFIQDSYTDCGAVSSCSVPTCATGAYCMSPTTSGTVWVAAIVVGDNGSTHPTISSVTGGGGSWNLCAASACHTFVSGQMGSDAAYNFTGTAGTTTITVNLSATATSYFHIIFVELLPPSGYSASLDGVAVNNSSSCHICTAASPTVTQTDAIVQIPQFSCCYSDFNGWSSPYITDYNSIGICLNCSSGAAPTYTMATDVEHGSGPGPQVFTALAFKSTAGTFTTPAPFSLVQYAMPGNSSTISCSPTCNLTVPSTGSSHLLFLVEIDQSGVNNYMTGVTGGGTWVVPSACRSGRATANGEISCAYVLSSTSGATTLQVTMNSNSTSLFAYWEISRSVGSFVLDAGSATVNTAIASGVIPGVALTLSGTNDVIFQMSAMEGGVQGCTLYPYNFNAPGNFSGKLIAGPDYYAAALMNLNTVNGTAPTWAYPQEPTATTAVAGFAFK